MLKLTLLIVFAFAEVTVLDPLGLLRARTETNNAVKVEVETKGGDANSIDLIGVAAEGQQTLISKNVNGSKVTFSNVMPGQWRIKGAQTVSNVRIIK